jgi:hypothetical protein
MVRDRREEMRMWIARHISYFNNIVVTDGLSIDGTTEIIARESKIKLLHNKWEHQAHNRRFVFNEVPIGEWFVNLDTSKYMSYKLLNVYKCLIAYAIDRNLNCFVCLGTRDCVDSLFQTNNHQSGADALKAGQWQNFIYKKTPSMKVIGSVTQLHDGVVKDEEWNDLIIEDPDIWIHVDRFEPAQSLNLCYFVYHSSAGDYTDEFKKIADKYYKGWDEVKKALLSDSLPEEIMVWIEKNKGFKDERGYFNAVINYVRNGDFDKC